MSGQNDPAPGASAGVTKTRSADSGAVRSADRWILWDSRSAPAITQLLNQPELLDGTQQFSLRLGDIDLAALVLQRLFGALLGFLRLRFVEVLRADRGVSQNGDLVRLH